MATNISDVFSSDVFSVSSLTEGIELLPREDGLAGQAVNWESEGINTINAVFEKDLTKLSLIPTARRGTIPNHMPTSKRELISIPCPHMPVDDEILADSIQDVRAFGKATELQTINTIVTKKLEDIRRSLFHTFEYHRMGALKGTVLDADGTTVVVDLFAEFGTTRDTFTWDFGSAVSQLGQAEDVIDLIDVALGATSYTSITCLCGRTFFKNLKDHPLVREYWRETNTGKGLGSNPRTYPFGEIDFVKYTGTTVNGLTVAANEANFFPVGVPGLYQQKNAPGTFNETVNTIGREMYVKSKNNDWGTGVDMFGQSTVLHVCTRPKVLVGATHA